ncbi:outer membrane protein [Sphaerotilus hippei]|uniref:Outer membrane protein n=1 Tax=Sphaerotilus hippei TaxID=744406 RepID=A0A318HA75_9BURK|nr:OmpW family outer membrane protein [Sphaerotilus hippei]PXW99192.1 outer membrane protein [Sphaerotilus hippei]
MIKKLCIAAAVAALAPVAMAQSAGDLVVRARAVHLEAANNDSIAITDVTINNKWIPEVDFTYFVTPNFAAELILTVPQKQKVYSSAHGGQIGTLKHLPPTLTAQYHFTGFGPVKPYLGAGVNYTRFSSVNLPAGFSIEKNSFGLALQAGVDFALTKTVSFNIDVKKVQIRTDLSAGGTNLGTIKVDPTLIGMGFGYKF